ncbi:alpha/beta hydrolase [Martelella mangrovi]|uniref:Lysophospholipase n=1 Tax=Martelella mangrovi TaxID=1397477 RepID=A0ABV2I7D9_9HYPH
MTGRMRAFDGVGLRYALYGCEKARATVMIVAGRSEFIEKYAETVSDLRQAGYAVAVLDLRGQGGSDRRPEDRNIGHIERFSDYPRDILDFLEQHVRGTMPAPCFLLGHSLGGLIALSAAESGRERFAGLVLAAPFVGLRHDRYPTWLIRSAAWLACHTGRGGRQTGVARTAPPRFEDQHHTSDRTRYERNLQAARHDPPYLLGPVSYGWLSACIGEIKRMTKPERLASISCPVLVLSGGRDSVIPADAQARLAERLGAHHVVLPESGHEIFQEADATRDRALEATIGFLDTHSAATDNG